MLLPRYSIRTLLLIMVGVALFALLLTYALRGHAWMLGLALAVGSLAVVTVVHAALFLVVSLMGKVPLGHMPTDNSAAADLPRPPLPEAPH